MKGRYAAIITCVLCSCLCASDNARIGVYHSNYVLIAGKDNPIYFAYNNIKNFVHHAITIFRQQGSQYYSQLLRNLDATSQWMAEHPLTTTAASIVCIHAGLNGYGWWLSYHLQSPVCWSKWKYHLSNEELQYIAPQTLGYDLMCEIQRRYLDTQNPTDFSQPLITFYESITREYKLLQHYKFVCDMLNWLYLHPISWYNEKLYDLVEWRMQRLHIVWHIFVSWLAEYNIDNQVKSWLAKADISNYRRQTASQLRRTCFYSPC